jgi:hypothetical protein
MWGLLVFLSNAIEEAHMISKQILTIGAAALALFVSSASARADTNGDIAPSGDKLTVVPAVLTNSGEAKAPIAEVQYGRRAYRRGWYGYPYRSYSYYPRSAYYPGYAYNYSYYPRYSYGYYPRYAYSRPYYGGYYYPRYYTGYRGGFSYSTPGFYGSFYW